MTALLWDACSKLLLQLHQIARKNKLLFCSMCRILNVRVFVGALSRALLTGV